MLHWVSDHFSAERKLWLFACACCRRFWGYLRDECRVIVHHCEEMADEPFAKTESERNDLCGKANAGVALLDRHIKQISSPTQHDRICRSAAAAVCYAALGDPWGSQSYFTEMSAAESYFQCELLRDIFGNPFRTTSIDPDWLAWRHGTCVKLARTIYDDRRFDVLPILADALQEAGCCDEAILDHCREPGPHVRGCWVVDLILGKT